MAEELELKVPSVGESITEVQIGKWHKSVGEQVEKDENVVELESDKATVDLPRRQPAQSLEFSSTVGRPRLLAK